MNATIARKDGSKISVKVLRKDYVALTDQPLPPFTLDLWVDRMDSDLGLHDGEELFGVRLDADPSPVNPFGPVVVNGGSVEWCVGSAAHIRFR